MLCTARSPIQVIIEDFFDDIIAQKSPEALLSYFSTSHEIFVQHDHVDNPKPYPFVGRHAVRSYFDLLGELFPTVIARSLNYSQRFIGYDRICASTNVT